MRSARTPSTRRVTRVARPALAALTLSLIAVTQSFVVAPAHAACSTPVDQVAAIRQASSVFVGQVTGVEDISRRATVQVLEIWKGSNIGPTVVVNGSVAGTPQLGVNDRIFTPGGTYLFVPFGSRSPFLDEACSGTSLYSPTGLIPSQYHEALGTSEPRIPAPAQAVGSDGQEGGGATPYVLGGAGAIVVVLLLLVTLRRGKKQESGSAASVAPAQPTETSRRRGKKRRRQKEPRRLSPGSSRAPAESPALDLTAVAGRKKRRRRSKVKGPQASDPKKLGRSSGLANVKAMRKKTRRVKGRKRRRSKTRA